LSFDGSPNGVFVGKTVPIFSDGTCTTVFDAALCLGVCDKIVPGLMIGALSFGHLPFIFVPAGPMPSGLSNSEKSRVRELYAQGKVDREALPTLRGAERHCGALLQRLQGRDCESKR